MNQQIMNNDYVVLLHGIARTAKSMLKIETALQDAAYQTINIDYPSRKHTIEDLTDNFVRHAIEEHYKDRSKAIHFVTYSMGSLILRRLLSQKEYPQLGRVVMIAPPNKGSEVAEFLKKNILYKTIYGPTGQQLGVKEGAFVHQLEPPDFELGIIAGKKSLNPLFSMLILDGADDGTITIESTKIEGMKDHTVVPSTHLMIIKHPDTIQELKHFLAHGHFSKQNSKLNLNKGTGF